MIRVDNIERARIVARVLRRAHAMLDALVLGEPGEMRPSGQAPAVDCPGCPGADVVTARRPSQSVTGSPAVAGGAAEEIAGHGA